MTRIGQTVPGNEFVLDSSDGSTKFVIKNSLGFEVFSVDSKGNIRRRGKIGSAARP